MNTTITTATGLQYDLQAPRPAATILMDVAWSLAQINRFTGHCLRPYSVAEHSLLVAEIIEREIGLDHHAQLAGLMHDAHECYVGDVSTPAKVSLGPAWEAYEYTHQAHVLRCFGVLHTSRDFAQVVKRADLMALATERRDLLPDGIPAWDCLEGVEPIGWVRLDSPERRAMSWEDWRDAFIDRFHELDYARLDEQEVRHA